MYKMFPLNDTSFTFVEDDVFQIFTPPSISFSTLPGGVISAVGIPTNQTLSYFYQKSTKGNLVLNDWENSQVFLIPF